MTLEVGGTEFTEGKVTPNPADCTVCAHPSSTQLSLCPVLCDCWTGWAPGPVVVSRVVMGFPGLQNFRAGVWGLVGALPAPGTCSWGAPG